MESGLCNMYMQVVGNGCSSRISWLLSYTHTHTHTRIYYTLVTSGGSNVICKVDTVNYMLINSAGAKFSTI